MNKKHCNLKSRFFFIFYFLSMRKKTELLKASKITLPAKVALKQAYYEVNGRHYTIRQKMGEAT